MRKPKPLDFKKGDDVIYIDIAYGVRLTHSTVTVVRQDKGMVYVKSVSEHGWEVKRSFGRDCGMFQENPYPIWKLRKLNGDDFKALEKRARHSRKEYEKCNEAYRLMEIELEELTRAFRASKRDELTANLKSGGLYAKRVAAKMGFKEPKKLTFNFK